MADAMILTTPTATSISKGIPGPEGAHALLQAIGAKRPYRVIA